MSLIFDEIDMIKYLIQDPFALFQEQVCMYESQINDTDVLSAFQKNFWLAVPQDVLFKTDFRGLYFCSIKFAYNHRLYLLTVVPDSYQVQDWKEEEWRVFFQKIQAAKAILSQPSGLLPIHTYDAATLQHEQSVQNSEQKIDEALLDFSDNYQFEKLFLQLLRTSDTSVLNKMVYQLYRTNQSTLSENPVQENKYRFVTFVTLITRTAISYGCPVTLAYRLSDKCIRKMDAITTQAGFVPILNQTITEFAILIRTRTITPTKGIIKECIAYIHSHLYDDLSNSDIAHALAVHPAYLSSTFKKTVGTSLRKFITTARITEAKHLLSNTDASFKDISASLHFANQSYFCKLFKAETTYTPKEFRLLF